MKQYKSFSLTLLLSASAFAMQSPERVEAGRLLQKNAEAATQDLFEQSVKESIALTKQLDTQLALPQTDTQTTVDFYVSPEKGYESDSEKGLSKENIEIYRLNKLAVSIKQILIDANPLLLAWFKEPVNTQPSTKLADYTKDLDAQLNRMEAWQKQIGKYDCKNSTGLRTLKTCFSHLTKQVDKFTSQKNFAEATQDIAHPAVQFLMTSERLNDLLHQ